MLVTLQDGESGYISTEKQKGDKKSFKYMIF